MNIMVDLETVGVRPTSGILSIGAIPFDLDGVMQDPFYRRIDLDDSIVLGFTMDDSTMKWWDSQDADTRNEAFNGSEGVRDAITDFAAYLRKYGSPLIWGNGADFDNVLLNNHFLALNIEQPWQFYNNRCFRTLKALYPMITYVKPRIAHNALEDAKAQAVHAVRILNWIKGRIPDDKTS